MGESDSSLLQLHIDITVKKLDFVALWQCFGEASGSMPRTVSFSLVNRFKCAVGVAQALKNSISMGMSTSARATAIIDSSK